MLRTSHELARFDVEAIDGMVGRVRDLLFDPSDWRVSRLLVDARGWFSHHDVLLDPVHVQSIRVPEETLVLHKTKAEIEAASHAMTSAAKPPPPLQGTEAIAGFEVIAEDGTLGQVHGLMIETRTWKARYVIVDTGELIAADIVLVAPQAISHIDWNKRVIEIALTCAGVAACPPFDAQAELTREYEAFLHDYYGWHPYWAEPEAD